MKSDELLLNIEMEKCANDRLVRKFRSKINFHYACISLRLHESKDPERQK